MLASLVGLQILNQESSRLSAEFGQYKFVQSVVPQVAYATLSRRDRKASHLAVIGQYEANCDSAGDLAPIIAQHYLDAIEAVPGDPDVEVLKSAAITELRRAATRARSLGSPAEAAGHLSSALMHASDKITQAGLDSELAWALLDAEKYLEAVDHAVRATEVFDELGDPVAAGRARGQDQAGRENRRCRRVGRLVHGPECALRPVWSQLARRRSVGSCRGSGPDEPPASRFGAFAAESDRAQDAR
ncbi:MAG TPA: hypothetical protein VFC57_02035 [Aeromicrobium sp.]|nr:hypothetical protein [Aeromicrobium sp.]